MEGLDLLPPTSEKLPAASVIIAFFPCLPAAATAEYVCRVRTPLQEPPLGQLTVTWVTPLAATDKDEPAKETM